MSRRLVHCFAIAASALGVAVFAAVSATRAMADPHGPIPVQAQGPPRRLCGHNRSLDILLGCASSGAARQTAATGAQGAGSSTPGSALQSPPPVSRTSTKPRYLPDVLLVRFRRNVSDARAVALLRSLGLHTREQIADLHVRAVSVSPARRAGVLAALRRSRLVASSGRDEVLRVAGITTNDTFFPQQWGLQLAGFTSAWADTRGAPIVVAVVDTGVDASQPDLVGAVRPGVDLVNGDSDAADDNGHGTAVAGVIAARADNGVGGAGVCWACQILPIKVMGADGSGDLGTVAAGITRAADLGARVINLSLGGPVGLDVLQQAISYATGKGALVVAAAGNDGLTSAFYPASYPQVLSVAATDQHDQLYSWSERGPWVNVSAPGCNVAPLLNDSYGEFCGTSSATPLVAGLAALAFAAQPNATPVQLTQAIEQAARRLAVDIAFGRIDAAATLAALGATPATPTRVSQTLTGMLSPTRRTQTYTRAIANGAVAITLRFYRHTRLALTIRDSLGHRVTHSGRSPLILRQQLPAGTMQIQLRSSPRTRTRYTLTLSYPHP